jgi:hypothetical protein
LPLKPASMTIDFGMNDAHEGESSVEKYALCAHRLAKELKQTNCRVAFISSSPEEKYENGPGGSHFNLMLDKYTRSLQQVAESENVPFVDQLHPFIEAVEKGRKAAVLGNNGEPRLVPDAVHPNWAGHLLMADLILKGLGASPLVSAVEIDGAARTVVSEQKCKATIDPPTGTNLHFTRVDEALPMPIPDDARLALSIPGIDPLTDLSQYMLKVTDLPDGQYSLLVDGQKTASLSASDLNKGVNLTMVCGPIRAQALDLFKQVIAKNNLFFERWRNVQLFEAPAWLQDSQYAAKQTKELKRLDDEITQKEKQIDALRQPKPHQFELAAAAAPN